MEGKKKEVLFWFYSYAEYSDIEFRFDTMKLCLGFTLNMNFNMISMIVIIPYTSKA